MSIVTRIASWLGRRTPAPTPKPKAQRDFAAARIDRLTNSWKSSAQSADSTLRFSLPTLRNRSRDLAENSDYVSGYLELLRNKVVGSNGIGLQVQSKGGDGEFDDDANDAIEKSFEKWGKRGSCTVCGRLSWKECLGLALISMARDGEVFIRLVRQAGVNQFNFALQFIEADMVDINKNDVLTNGNTIRMGVEITPFDRPVAYYVFERHPGDLNLSAMAGTKTVRIPAEEMIHLYRQLRPGQTRGIPWTASVMTRLHHLGAYEEAAIINARTGASKMGFFTRTAESMPENGYGTDEAGRTISEVEPGSLETLPVGVGFEPFDPAYPSNEFDSFVKRQIKGASCGLPGAAYAELSNDLESVSFSSIRQGTLNSRDSYRDLQRLLIDSLCVPVYEAWLTMALSFGLIVVVNGKRGPNSRLSVVNYDKYNQPFFIGRGWDWVDPLKDQQANSEGLSNGTLTLTRLHLEQGSDLNTYLAVRSRERKLGRKYDVDLDAVYETAKKTLPVSDPAPPPPGRPPSSKE